MYVVFLLELNCIFHLQRTEVPLGILLMLMLLSDTSIFMYLAQKILSAPATCFETSDVESLCELPRPLTPTVSVHSESLMNF